MANSPNTPRSNQVDGAHTVGQPTTDHGDAHRDEPLSWKDTVFGSGRSENVRNVSWGAIFAGIVTFLAIVLLFSLAVTSFGLDGSSTGAIVLTILGIVLGLFLGGAVAGALAVRAGFLHGFVTWAGSVVAAVVLAAMIALGAAGAAGGLLGNVTSGLGQAVQVSPGDSIPTPTQDQLDQAGQTYEEYKAQAEEVAQDVADATQKGAGNAFWGLLLGSLVASLGGLVGSRSVANKQAEIDESTGTARRV